MEGASQDVLDNIVHHHSMDLHGACLQKPVVLWQPFVSWLVQPEHEPKGACDLSNEAMLELPLLRSSAILPTGDALLPSVQART